ncbi:MAG: zinc-dependent alcohol dehydrogenase family protein [Spirochaetales bacterium]|nr:zinc-dependent alcohol dehydrogenase family protein [Spirochaetales bacterium]
MKYALLHGMRDLRIEEKPVPEITPDRIIIKIFSCGICGTDVLIYNGKIPHSFPYSPGHECSGIVTDVGKNITHIKSGDRVAVDPNYSCGFCYYCRHGYPNLCENQKKIKVKSNGGFAEYISVPETLVYKIPDDVSFGQAALIETLSCCIHIIEEADIKVSDTVVIIGGGAMGLILLQLARKKGAAGIILSEPVESKRQIALKLGADIAIDPTRQDLASVVRSMSKQGANVVIEGLGLPDTIEESLTLLAKKGRLILPGFRLEERKIHISPYFLTTNEITIKGVFLNPFSFSKAVDQVSNLECDLIITGNYPLEQINEAMKEAEKGNQIKLIIKPNGGYKA